MSIKQIEYRIEELDYITSLGCLGKETQDKLELKLENYKLLLKKQKGVS